MGYSHRVELLDSLIETIAEYPEVEFTTVDAVSEGV